MPENTPPWGTDDEFKPEQAWSLIQTLRNEVKEAKLSASTAVSERDKYAEQVEELQATVQLTDDTAKELEGNLGKEKFGRKFDRLAFERNIPLSIASTITADTEEDAIAKLDSLAEWRGKQEPQERAPDPAQAAEPVTDEKANLAAQFFGM